MALTVGARLGPYEILAALGAGGMGEVWKARDSRLNRTVAIKVLAADTAANRDANARFEREARAIAALSHPHICTLHDVGEHDGVTYLVMEHLEGETLAERIARSPLPLAQTLDIAIQIASALDKAHRAGIVHRDLKPGNIMLTKSGAKLLDFGLAKLWPTEPDHAAGLTAMPTMSASLTGQGTIVGTLQYMAPEQVEGKAADARTDIFAFGVVVYEMATGTKAFEGKSQASLIAAILEREPAAISTIQPITPNTLDRLVAACMAKDPDDRFQSAGDIKRELEWIAEAGSRPAQSAPALAEEKRTLGSLRLAWSMTAVLAVALAAALYFAARTVRKVEPAIGVVRFTFQAPEHVLLAPNSAPAISPDGRSIAFSGVTSQGRSLWVRSIDGSAARQLLGSDGAVAPFWSPDSRVIAFAANGKLMRIDAAGGAPQTICDGPVGTGAWGSGGVILFSRPGQGLFSVPATGGRPVAVTTLDASLKDRAFSNPAFLPDGRHFLYLSRSETPERVGVFVGSLDGGGARRLLENDAPAFYAEPGYVIFGRGRALMAQQFDPVRLTVSGATSLVEDGLGPMATAGDGLGYAVSDTALVYRAHRSASAPLAWFDRSGRQGETLGEPGVAPDGVYSTFDLSRDGTRVAMPRQDPQTGYMNLWTVETTRGLTARVTRSAANCGDPRWSPDGREIMFDSMMGGVNRTAFRVGASGGNVSPVLPAWPGPGAAFALDHWSPDGRVVLYHNINPPELWTAPVDGTGKPQLVIRALTGAVDQARFSYDGHWIAYNANESGRYEVYIVPFPPTGEKWQISTAGGVQPMWRVDGKELFYLSLNGVMTAVDVRLGRTVETREQRALFRTPLATVRFEIEEYAVTGDGQRFLIRTPIAGAEPPSITVVLNWASLFEKKP